MDVVTCSDVRRQRVDTPGVVVADRNGFVLCQLIHGIMKNNGAACECYKKTTQYPSLGSVSTLCLPARPSFPLCSCILKQSKTGGGPEWPGNEAASMQICILLVLGPYASVSVSAW